MIALLIGTALATPGFDPTTPEVRLEGRETWTQAEDLRLWNALERWEDPDRTLFEQESFNQGTQWADADHAPWVATAFGTARPHSSTFLLHVGLHEPTATGTPVLMVHGAGDNGSRGFITVGTHMDRLNRPVFALTFAHPHGDVLRQAEIVADALAVITARTGSEQVDVVAHSKGGIAAAVYASHTAGQRWGRADYEGVGTPYRGDIRRLVLIAAPLGGVDVAYRWPALNLVSLESSSALSPASWRTYYPSTTALLGISTPLTDQDHNPDGADLFPGQRQLLARQSAPLPGSQLWLGGYALQPDWYTTYEGGLGFWSRSQGIDAAIQQGGNLIGRLHDIGADPDIELYLLAGSNPMMPNGDSDFQDAWDGVATESEWADMLTRMSNHGTHVEADADELKGLADGAVVLGEVTGPSDGLVFVDSALDAGALDARGAEVIDARTLDLSHLDLLYASPITGELLAEAGEANPSQDAWMRAWGRRYTSEDSIGWIEAAIADPPDPTDPTEPIDTGLPEPEDTGTPVAPDPEAQVATEFDRPCGSCSSGGPAGAGWLGVGLALLWRRRL